MRTIVLTSALLALTATAVHAQSLDIGAGSTGLSIGNSPVWTGVRINWEDGGVRRVNGVNLTLWKPGDNPDFRMNGVAFGVVGPGVGTLNGIALGLGGVVAERRINGIAAGGLGVVSQGPITGAGVAGLGVVSQGPITGAAVAGLGVVSEGELRGVSVAGLGVVSEGAMTGISLAGLGVVSQGAMTGVNVGGLGVVSQGAISGLNAAGLGLVAEGSMTGINLGGLAAVSQGSMRGLNVGGLAVVGGEDVTGLNLAVGAVEGGAVVRGITAAGYRVRAPHMEGVSGAVGMLRVQDLTGLSIAGFNDIRGTQRGLTIGIYNSAEVLNGVQIGLLNRAKRSRSGVEWLPVINF